MTDLFLLNIVTALVAMVLMLLVTIGFAPHLRFTGSDKTARMGLFVALTSGLVWVRLLWWSLLRPLVGLTDVMPSVNFSHSTNAINIGFNAWAIWAALVGLSALYRSIPTKDRHKFNWLNAPFYPRRLTFYWKD